MFDTSPRSDNVILVRPKDASLEKEFYQQRRTVKFDPEGSFLAVIRPVIILGQVFGIFPVVGYGAAQADQIRFEVCSLRMFYSVLLQMGGATMSGFSLATFWTTGVEFSKILSWTFFTINLLITTSFTVLARRWPELMKEWENTEQSLPDQPLLAASNKKLHRKVVTTMTILMASALFEHALAKPAGLYRAYRCGIQDLLEAHLMQAFPEMFSFIAYNIYVGFVAQVVTTILTFYWNFVDLFLITLSLGLRQNLIHMNQIILNSRAQFHSELFWYDHWKHYQKVCELVHLFKRRIAYLVILSFTNNLFFICIQLIGVLKPVPGLIMAIYVWYSLAHLMTRMILVAMYAASIHDESRKLLPVFRAMPSQFYNKEIQRFHQQMENDTVALSGYGFFHLTRKLILKVIFLNLLLLHNTTQVAGTVVTYELVLLQVNDSEEKHGDQNPCT